MIKILVDNLHQLLCEQLLNAFVNPLNAFLITLALAEIVFEDIGAWENIWGRLKKNPILP